jgi:hypothetical protein
MQEFSSLTGLAIRAVLRVVRCDGLYVAGRVNLGLGSIPIMTDPS